MAACSSLVRELLRGRPPGLYQLVSRRLPLACITPGPPSSALPSAGGRSGATYETSEALGDLWVFDLATRRWQEVLRSGLRPLRRFLFSATQYAPGGGGGGGAASRLLVFGGETVRQCKLNDVWELDLRTLQWEELSPPTFCKRHCDALF